MMASKKFALRRDNEDITSTDITSFVSLPKHNSFIRRKFSPQIKSKPVSKNLNKNEANNLKFVGDREENTTATRIQVCHASNTELESTPNPNSKLCKAVAKWKQVVFEKDSHKQNLYEVVRSVPSEYLSRAR